MKPARLPLLLTTLFCLAPTFAAHAQRVVEGDLQTQMTTEEFKAAGLEKLSAQELAALNAWLQGKVQQAATSAIEQAREEGRQVACLAETTGGRYIPANNASELQDALRKTVSVPLQTLFVVPLVLSVQLTAIWKVPVP